MVKKALFSARILNLIFLLLRPQGGNLRLNQKVVGTTYLKVVEHLNLTNFFYMPACAKNQKLQSNI